MKKSYPILLLFFLITNSAFCQIEPSWQKFTGWDNSFIFRTDTGLVVVGQHFKYISPNHALLNQIHFNYFDRSGNFLGDMSWGLPQDTVYFGFSGVSGKKSVTQLRNGQFLIGGLYVAATNNKYIENNQEKEVTFNKYNLPRGNQEEVIKEFPIIVRVNKELDSIVNVKVPHDYSEYPRIDAIFEIDLDSIIMVRRDGSSGLRIFLADSLLNIRWETEFGNKYGYWPSIEGIEKTEDNCILVQVEYDHFTYWFRTLPVHLYKFNNQGELLWVKSNYSPPQRMPYGAALMPLENDRFLFAYNDFSVHDPHQLYSYYYFHDETALDLLIIDGDGNIHQRKNMQEFFRFVEFSNNEIYEPGEASQWYIPFPFHQTYIPRHITPGPDNSIIITGHHLWVHRRGFMVKLDQDLIPQWIRLYEIDKPHWMQGTTFPEYYSTHELYLNAPLWDEQGFILSASFNVYSIDHDDPDYPAIYGSSGYRSGVLILTDEHGCLERGCHLADNVPVHDIISGVSFYPNPVTTTLKINIEHPALEDKRKVLFISDLSGRHVLHEVFTQNYFEVPTGSLPKGIFIAYLLYNGQIIKAEKIMVGRK